MSTAVTLLRLVTLIASMGHLQTITSLKDIDTKNNYNPTFKIIENKKSYISQMSKIISSFDKNNIIIATDDDREGEAIGWHICNLFSLDIKKTKRIIFHEITKNAIQEAIKIPTTINMSIVYAQFSRQILDIIVGFKISPFYGNICIMIKRILYQQVDAKHQR